MGGHFAQMVLGIGYWVLGIGYWVLGIGYWVLGIGRDLPSCPIGRSYHKLKTITNCNCFSALGVRRLLGDGDYRHDCTLLWAVI